MKNSAATLHIFRSGSHTTSGGESITFSDADIAQVAAAYDPAVYQSPIVVGHPKTDDPAFGWVNKLSVEGTGLYAEPTQVDPAFAAMVNDGKYKNISVALWPPSHPSNPKPEGYYLRHVGFLGAAAPAVKGLKHATFAAADDKFVTIEFSATDGADSMLKKFLQMFTSELVRNGLQSPQFNESKDTKIMNTDAAALQVREDALKAKELAFAETQAAAAKAAAALVIVGVRAKNVEFADKLAKEGKILPTQKAEIVETLTSLHSATPVEFDEGGATIKKSPADVMREILDAKKPVINYAVKTPAGAVTNGAAVTFAAPSGMQVDPERAAIHSAILEYATTNKVTYEVALPIVMANFAAANAAK